MHTMLITLSAAMLLAGPLQRSSLPAAGGAKTLPECLVTLIDEVEVPAKEAGVLEELLVKEGDDVKQGDKLGRIDDALVLKARDAAQYRYQVAKKEAENDVNVRYARAANLVADAEYNQAVDANAKAPGAITQAELRRLLLECRKSSLAIEQADHDFGIAAVTAQVRQAELEQADEDAKRRQILAPVGGMVVKRYLHAGEWVKPGDPVLRIVRMDRLRIEAFLSADEIAPVQVAGQPVTVKVRLPPGEDRLFTGNIVFVSPIVEVGKKFLVWAEVVNQPDPATGQWLLRPGLDAEMTITLKR